MADRKLVVEVIGNSESLERAFARSGKAGENFSGRISKASRAASLAIGGGLAIAAKIGISELVESQKVSAQTAATLKATGGAAKVAAKHIEDLAGSLSKMSGVDDEAIQAGENLLLTFKNVRNEVGKGNAVFDRATKAALDLSVAGFGDLASTSKGLGKALNDPVRGISALSRAGVTFSAKQKAMIQGLVKTGHTLRAQKLILKEVQGQVGGSAKAYGTTLAGQVAKARNAFEEVAGSLAEALLPAMLSLAKTAARASSFLAKNQKLAKGLVIGLASLAVVLGTVSVASKAYAAGLAIVRTAQIAATAAQWALNVALTANPIGAIVVGIAALAAGLVLAWKKSETFRRIVKGALASVSAAADKLISAFKAVLDFMRSQWKTIAVLISGPFAPIVLLATDAFGIRSALIGAFKAIRNAITDAIRGAVAVVSNAADRVGAAAKRIGRAITDGILEGLGNIGALIWAKLKGALGGVVGKVTGLLGIHSPSKVFAEIGKSIGEGLVQGIERSMKGVDKMLTRDLVANIKATAKIESPGRLKIPAPELSFPPARRSMMPSLAFAAPRPIGSSGGDFVVHTHVNLDGRELAFSTKRQLIKLGAQTAPSRRGRHGGRNLGLG